VKYSNYSDQVLIELFKKGNNKAFETIIERYKHKTFNFVLMMVQKPHLAEDIVQDTFLKVVKSINNGKYYDDGKLGSWIIRIAHNLVIDYFRKEKQFNSLSADDPTCYSIVYYKSIDNNHEDYITKNDTHFDVRKLLDYLPFEQREVVIMRIYLDMSFKEIAEINNISLNTALGRMRYALINLRKLAKKHMVNY